MIVDYEDHLAKYPTGFMFRHMNVVVSLWPPNLRERSHIKAKYEPSNYLQGPATVGRYIADIIPQMGSSFVRGSLGRRVDFSSEVQE